MKLVSLALVCVGLALVIAAGCHREDPLISGASAARAEEPAPSIDPRSLVDLAGALRAVETGDPDDADIGYAEIEEGFEGRRYRWQLYLIPALCRETQCNALPFKDGGREDGIVAGWMPRLALSADQRRELLARCGDTPQCPFTVEARLADLIVSTEKFTSLDLDRIELLD